ncbi:MAG: SET domain-containing protein-lysine N-methyltransferase [Alphaproteobacteria bacterium]
MIEKVRWKDTSGKGRGVFALEDIEEKELVEKSPVVPFPKSEMDLERKYETALGQYQLWWSDEKDKECAIGFGYLMLYNHSENPNIKLVRNYEDKTISVIARRSINIGEELVHQYHSGTWFEVKQ